MDRFHKETLKEVHSAKYLTSWHYIRFFSLYIYILIIFKFTVLDIAQDRFMRIGLCTAFALLFFRQIFMWRDNRQLLRTYHSLNEQLEDKVNEGIQALSKSEQQYKTLFENHPDAVFSLDMSGNFQSANTSCMEILGYTFEELNGQSFLNYVVEDDQYMARDAIRQAKTGLSQTFEVRACDKEKEFSYLQVTLIPTLVGNKTIGMYGIARDTTELKQKQRQVEHMAFHDALTSLPNRRKFENCLAEALKTATKRETMTAVLFIDLDRFKKVNDRLGHDIGDLLLIEVSKRLQQSLRSKDIVARQGGDEFTVLLTDVFSQQGAALTAERLLELLNEPIYVSGNELKITPSIGIALHPSHGTNVTKLMKNADIAMYRAKASGKNKYIFYSQEMSDVEDEKHFLEGELNQALQNNELVLHYQPQVNMETHEIIGFEALLRWKHPKFGMVSPAEFIPIAEETGLIIPIGEWILRTACQQAIEWHDRGYAHLKVGVNLSPLQFNQSNLVELVSSILEETKLPAHLLDLEITEGVAMKKEEQVIKKLNQLKRLNVQISIDDFGTGYSSLSYLTKYPIHTLKIAREFIKEIQNNPQEEAIISSIIMMAKNLQLTVIAEGVETNEQWSFLSRQQCDQIQGFYISKPVDADKVWDVLLSNRIKLASKNMLSL
ncbi:putative bifunctional diguanylate cyclase/phosphodiesterase [Ectobacillus panaciterrae]|uniref:putative bifunctional diguanylate cyclase/phosphodiesterase n=1 Tax=Ectobacillus panaciterrae TaxID=363872 RepID=UPI00041A6BE1|nr:EAL domain-containing protein [Ectobacillus panaciterrae]